MRFKAVTVNTVGIPAMEFYFEQPSVNLAMEYMCRSIPMMRGAPVYDFDLFCVPDEGDEVAPDGTVKAPILLGRTRTSVVTRFTKAPGAGYVDSVPQSAQRALAEVE